MGAAFTTKGRARKKTSTTEQYPKTDLFIIMSSPFGQKLLGEES